jgi:hypothetical protein
MAWNPILETKTPNAREWLTEIGLLENPEILNMFQKSILPSG